jgi:hypothetical protein
MLAGLLLPAAAARCRRLERCQVSASAGLQHAARRALMVQQASPPLPTYRLSPTGNRSGNHSGRTMPASGSGVFCPQNMRASGRRLEERQSEASGQDRGEDQFDAD